MVSTIQMYFRNSVCSQCKICKIQFNNLIQHIMENLDHFFFLLFPYAKLLRCQFNFCIRKVYAVVVAVFVYEIGLKASQKFAMHTMMMMRMSIDVAVSTLRQSIPWV